MHYTNWLRWGILAGIFVVPFILFVAPNSPTGPGLTVLGNMFFPYITGKNFLFRIVVDLMVLFYILLALKEPKYRPRSSGIMWTVLAFVGWMAVATAFAIDPVKSFWSNFERMEGYVGLVHLCAWFVVTGAMLSATRQWERWFNASVVASVFMSLYAFLQVTHLLGFAPTSQSGARADATFGNAIYLAVYFLFMFFITLYMLLRRQGSPTWQGVYGVALVLQVMGIYVTETRGAILGLLAGLLIAALYVALFVREREWRTLRRVCVGGIAALVLLVAGFVALKDTSFVKNSSTLNRLANISLEDRTTVARFQIWYMAWQGVQERPVQGWGQENFSYIFNTYYNPSMYDQEQWFDRAHNQFIDWFVAGGIPAGLLYAALYAVAAWGVIRARGLSGPERAILLGLLGGFAFNNLFVFDNLFAGIYFFALLAFIHAHTARELPSRLFLTRPLSEHGMAVAAPIVAVVMLGGTWALNMPGIARAHALVDAIQTQTQSGPRDPAQNLASFKSALGAAAWPGGALGQQEVVEQLAQYASGIDSRGASPAVAAEVRAAAAAALEQLTTDRPGDARLELFYGTYLGQSGDLGRAVEHLQKALAASPKKQQIMVQLGLTLIQGGNTEAGLGQLQQALDLAPESEFARVMLAAGNYYAGRYTQGDQVLRDGFGSTAVDNNQLLSVFMDTKQYAKAEAVWKLRLNNSPDNPELLLGLAQVYFISGDMARTVATLKEIQRVSPSQAAQMQQVINQIESGALRP